jgi:hypothetical protein
MMLVIGPSLLILRGVTVLRGGPSSIALSLNMDHRKAKRPFVALLAWARSNYVVIEFALVHD